MRRFIIYISSLLIPLLLVMLVLEGVVTKIPNSYSYKYNYVKTHGNSIKILAIGHSQLYDGFDPKVFDDSVAFNLSNSSQEYIDNYYILQKLMDDMPNLKVVIMPLAYPEVSAKGKKSELSERSTYYHEYMHIDYDGQIPWYYRYESINIPKAFSKIFDYYVKHEDIVGCDALGRRDKYSVEDRVWKLEDNPVISKYYTLKQHSNFILRGEIYLEKIVKLLKERNICLFLVSTPYYEKSLLNLNIDQQVFLNEYAAKIAKTDGVMYFNYQSDTTFTEKDFYDEAHLSEYGAEKFTKLLKKQILLHEAHKHDGAEKINLDM